MKRKVGGAAVTEEVVLVAVLSPRVAAGKKEKI